MQQSVVTKPAHAFGVARIFIIAIAMLLFTSAARAQMSPLFPPPITTPELLKYADIIGLSDQQKLSLLAAHDEYKSKVISFQERDVRKFQDNLIDMGLRFQRSRFQVPPREELEAVVSEYKRLLNSSHGLDRAFFDSTTPLLTDEQLLKLPRVRTLRELSIYRELVTEFAGEFNPGAGADFTEILQGGSFPPDTLVNADPILAEYEVAMLNRGRDIFQAITEATKVILDLIDELGIRGMTPDKMMAMAQDEALQVKLQATFDEASKPFQAAAYQMSQLNYRTFKKLAAALPPLQARLLRERYYDIAFDDAYRGKGEWEQRYADAIQLPFVTDSQKAEIEVQRDSFHAREDGMVDSVVADMEAARQYRTFRQLENEEDDPLEEKIEELRERRASLSSNAISTLEGILGAEYVAVMEQKKREQEEQAATAKAAQAAAVASAAAAPAREVIEPAKDPFYPSPLSLEDLKRLNAALDLSEEDRSLVSTLYDEYRAQFDALKATALDVAADIEPTSTEYGKAQRERFEKLIALDVAFFEDVKTFIAAQEKLAVLNWGAQVRARGVLHSTALALSRTWGETEAYIDPVTVLLGIDFDRNAIAAIDRVAQDYAAQSDPHLRVRIDAARESTRRWKQWRSAAQRGQEGAKAAEFAREKYDEAQREVHRASRQLLTVNRQTIEQLCQMLPSQAWQLKQAYNRTAFPEVYQVGQSAQTAVEQVLGMQELSDSQRLAVNEIGDTYRAEYADICERMIDLRRSRLNREDRDEMPSKEEINRWLDSERLEFDLEELNARTRMRLGLIIGNDLAQRVAELKEES